MRIVSRLLEGIVALVFVFGLLESLLTGGRTGARGLGRRISSGQSSEAWLGGYAGAMAGDRCRADYANRLHGRTLG